MRFFYALIASLFLFPSLGWSQPGNDECTDAILIDDVNNWCSGFAAFSNVGATISNVPSPSCFSFGEDNNDVWFTFIADASDVNISVVGATEINQGGTLENPQFTLYSGGCGVLTEVECASDQFGSGTAQSFAGPLNIGEQYYIQVSGDFGNVGTFELCVNNFNLVPEPSGDCNTGVVLCDKSPFTVPSVVGVGLDPGEISNTSCGCPITESSSTWYKWTAEESGSLTFTLTPLNPADDIDFVVYELPNGLDDCNSKIELRCMASGRNVGQPFAAWQACTGPTGLSENDGDNSESCGCQAGDNNFASAIQIEAGRSYALVVNNFSDSGSGFSVEFGGTGIFRGPEASFEVEPQTICVGESVTFTDNSTAPDGLDEWEWNFGSGASPQTSTSPTPPEITYNTPGLKSVLLRVTSSDGCLVSYVGTVNVECCDDHFFLEGATTDLLCADDPIGSVDLTVENDYGPYDYLWTTGSNLQDLNGLDLGAYTVTISDAVGCDTTATFEVEGPPPIQPAPQVTMPTCNGGMDGAVTMQVSGGVPPYEYDFGSGFSNDNTLSGIPIGDYLVTIRDQNGCLRDTLVEVRELELILDPSVQAVTRPSCNGFSDGSINVVIDNGLPPYEYNFNDGNGWVSANTLNNLSAGAYLVDVRDANLCVGSFEFVIEDYPPLSINLSVMDVSCFGYSDGVVTAVVEGGVGDYTYQWSDGQTGVEATDLPAGVYSITVTDDNGCVITANVDVKQPEPLFVDIVDIQDVICFGESTGAIEMIGSGGVPPFEYSIDGENFQSDTSFGNLPAGDYTLTVRDAEGCEAAVGATVTQPAELIVDAGPDQVIRLGFEADLLAQANESPVIFNWTPAETLDCTDCPDPTAMSVRSTTYFVTVTNELGCTALDSVRVTVVPDRPVYIPNAISPNGDGLNDGFTVFAGPAAREIRTMKVFSRWGSLVYEGEGLPIGVESAGWDGTFNGQPVNSGVFAYLVEVEFIDDVVVLYEGDITVLQ